MILVDLIYRIKSKGGEKKFIFSKSILKKKIKQLKVA